MPRALISIPVSVPGVSFVAGPNNGLLAAETLSSDLGGAAICEQGNSALAPMVTPDFRGGSKRRMPANAGAPKNGK